MQTLDHAGFSVVELAVAAVVVSLLAVALVPACVNVAFCNYTPVAVGCLGRDIYVAISGANMAREPLGLPPVWPADSGLWTNAAGSAVVEFDFANSTDYYRCTDASGRRSWRVPPLGQRHG